MPVSVEPLEVLDILRSIPDAVLTVDASRRLTALNEPARALTVRGNDRRKLTSVLDEVARDDRILAATVCSPALRTIASTGALPATYTCEALARRGVAVAAPGRDPRDRRLDHSPPRALTAVVIASCGARRAADHAGAPYVEGVRAEGSSFERVGSGAAPTGEPLGQVGVVLNERAGSGRRRDTVERVRAALAAASIRATLWPAHGRDIVAAARRAAADATCGAVIAAGGDGTVSAVAGVIAGTDKILGVLPAGTLNHFAKDLGMPPGIEEAAVALARARVRRIDVGEVNGLVFVNNSSVGIYPRVVRQRERLLDRLGGGKWLATAWAAAAVVARLQPVSLRIRWEGGVAAPRTTFAFVGNNRYDTALLATQRRAALDAGVLGVFVGREHTRLGLLRVGARAAVGRLDERDLDALEVREVTLESHRRTIWVALDGEVRRLRPPIRYRIRPGALRVLAPEPQT